MSEEKYLTVPFECDRQKVRPITYQGSLSEFLYGLLTKWTHEIVHQVCQIKGVGTEEVRWGKRREGEINKEKEAAEKEKEKGQIHRRRQGRR